MLFWFAHFRALIMEREREDLAPIFIVDDAQDDCRFIARVLGQCKILNPALIKSADRCIEYFDRALQIPDMKLPVLILLDLNMAPTSGVQVLEHLHGQGITARVPVVMLSGMRDIKVIQHGYQLGARTFLIKPISQEDVIHLLSAIRTINIDEVSGGYVLSAVGTEKPRETDTDIFRRRPSSFSA